MKKANNSIYILSGIFVHDVWHDHVLFELAPRASFRCLRRRRRRRQRKLSCKHSANRTYVEGDRNMEMLPQPSITSLLNSLHTHLQSQTQLLPTLHGQLGLPPTALADELLSLQQTLTRCVEDQIDGRRKQVDEWLSKCEGVEKECHRYGVALGGHIKGPGSTVGEARKEHVLPKRYDVLTELQEKLRQVRIDECVLVVYIVFISRFFSCTIQNTNSFSPSRIGLPCYPEH